MTLVKHPAKYSDVFIPIFAEMLQNYPSVLDIFAGTGKLAKIKDFGYTGRVICNEIEPEWANLNLFPVDEWHIGDAQKLTWCESFSIDAICTSPTYGNWINDHCLRKDKSKRIAYRYYLGRALNENNTGRVQWGEAYRNKHIAIWKECFRVLKNSGLLIVNISNHIRNGNVVNVVEWHKTALLDNGFILVNELQVNTPRMRFGENANKRVETESILSFIKP